MLSNSNLIWGTAVNLNQAHIIPYACNYPIATQMIPWVTHYCSLETNINLRVAKTTQPMAQMTPQMAHMNLQVTPVNLLVALMNLQVACMNLQMAHMNLWVTPMYLVWIAHIL